MRTQHVSTMCHGPELVGFRHPIESQLSRGGGGEAADTPHLGPHAKPTKLGRSESSEMGRVVADNCWVGWRSLQVGRTASKCVPRCRVRILGGRLRPATRDLEFVDSVVLLFARAPKQHRRPGCEALSLGLATYQAHSLAAFGRSAMGAANAAG